MTSATRAQRLIDEFENATCACHDENKARFGIAAVLRHIVDTEVRHGDAMFSFVPTPILEDLANALETPTLLERAINGDSNAAKKFLHEAGFTDKQGQWLPQYQPITETTNG